MSDSTDKWRSKPLDFKLNTIRTMDDLLQLEAKKIETLNELRRALIGHWMREIVPRPQDVSEKWVIELARARLKAIESEKSEFHYYHKSWHVDEAGHMIEWITPIIDKMGTGFMSLAVRLRALQRDFDRKRKQAEENY